MSDEDHRSGRMLPVASGSVNTVSLRAAAAVFHAIADRVNLTGRLDRPMLLLVILDYQGNPIDRRSAVRHSAHCERPVARGSSVLRTDGLAEGCG
jgi:hypothetical protein